MSEQRDFSAFVRHNPDGASSLELAVEGVACAGCLNKIESRLKAIPGIADARLNFTTKRLVVAWRDPSFDPAGVIDAIDALGYRSQPFSIADNEQSEAAAARFLMRCLGVAGFAAMNIMLLSVSVWSGNVTDITPETRDLFHWLSALIALPAAAYAGQPFFKSAWQALSARRVNMDVPISLGIVLALGMSVVETAQHAQHAYFDSAIMLIFFLLCGRYADHAVRRRTRAAAGNLAALKAITAHRFAESGELVTLPASALRAGDLILVRPGERIAADSIVIAGSSEIDEGLVTGESMPRRVALSTQVYAGTVNMTAALTLKVTAAGEDTLLQEIDRLLERAVAAKSQYVRLADRAAGYYAPVVHTTAALTLAGWLLGGASMHDAVMVAISVLIITCPCALALAIPAVQVVAANRLFRSGIFLNSGDAIERLADADTAIFDKTGTLTLPEPHVLNAGQIAPDLLERAARLALGTRHPLAAALAKHANVQTPYDDIVETAGSGIRTVVDGIEMRLGRPEFCGVRDETVAAATLQDPRASVLAFRHGDRHAVFTIGQSLRPDAAAALKSIAGLGLDIKILSGDRPEAVAAIAKAVGVSDWKGGLKPGEKVAILDTLKASGRKVLMIGDGINDAPALAAASVSLSPICAADLSQAHADGVFLGETLKPVREAIVTARRARTLMRQNLSLAVVYNALALPLAVAGLVTPLIAALAMSGSSMIVMLNSLRLGVARQDCAKTISERVQSARIARTA